MQTISFIGGGRISKILIQAFKNADTLLNKIIVFDVNDDILSSLKKKYPNVITTDKLEDVFDTDILFLAVHPPVAVETIEKIKGNIAEDTVLISFVPKITIEKTVSLLGGFSNVSRMNPSASTIVNKGVNPIAFYKDFDESKKNEIIKLLAPLGYMPEISDSKIEAYAVVSAMGHTYFNFQLKKLHELGVKFGMTEKEAADAISNMLWGTTETLFNSDLSYPEVVDLVPVKPMAEVEDVISGYYDQYLNGIFNKIKP